MTIEEARSILATFLPPDQAFSVDMIACRRSSGGEDIIYKTYIQDYSPGFEEGTDLSKVILATLGKIAEHEALIKKG